MRQERREGIKPLKTKSMILKDNNPVVTTENIFRVNSKEDQQRVDFVIHLFKSIRLSAHLRTLIVLEIHASLESTSD